MSLNPWYGSGYVPFPAPLSTLSRPLDQPAFASSNYRLGSTERRGIEAWIDRNHAAPPSQSTSAVLRAKAHLNSTRKGGQASQRPLRLTPRTKTSKTNMQRPVHKAGSQGNEAGCLRAEANQSPVGIGTIACSGADLARLQQQKNQGTNPRTDHHVYLSDVDLIVRACSRQDKPG